jgi:nucleoside-diphosphate-sugar epimerase
MQDQLHVVLGASGGAGNAIVHALVDRGHAVRAVNRTGTAEVPGGVERLGADVSQPSGAAAAVAGADVVYMSTQPPYDRWSEEFPSMVAAVIEATADVGARLIMVDNLYVYPPGTTEMSERSPESNPTKKGTVRRELAAMVRSAHDSGNVRVAIGRASDYFGPGADNSAITALSIARAVDGKPMRWMGRLDKRHSVAYLPDIARAYATLGESDRSDGETWILPHGPAPTGAEFLAAVNDALPEPVKTGALTKTMLRLAAPFHPMSRESLEVLYQWTDDFVADDSKFQRVFGPFATTPLDEAVRTTVDWYRDHESAVSI